MTPLPPESGHEWAAEEDGHGDDAVAQLRRQRDAAQALLQRRTRFFVAASHDLRQPLHALGLLTQALDGHALPEEARQLVQRMGHAVGMLEGMFDELLDLAKMEARLLAPELQPLRLQDVYDRIAVHVQPPAFDKGLALRFRGGQRWVRADPLLLERMLRNLVLNAIRYTEDGSVLVGVRLRGSARLHLQVCDSGIGIGEDALPHIFTPFVRADDMAPRHGALGPRGWGLGLAIVQRLAQAQGLALGVQSTLGRGSVFTLDLTHAAPAGPRSRVPLPGLTLAGHRVGVLVAQADLDEALCAMLTRWQARVQRHDALPLGLSVDDRPEVLITDQPHAADQLCRAWQQPVPTILLGADGPANAAGDVHALPLPLAPNRLRALIAYKLAGPRA